MSDIPTFIDFAKSGSFSGASSVSLPVRTANLDLALRTYMLSTTMQKNGWLAVVYPGPYTTVLQIEDSTSGRPAFGCKMGSNDFCTYFNSVGTVWWWHRTSRNVFGLSNTQDTSVSPYQLMQDIVNSSWACLPALFDGTFHCAVAGRFGGSVVNFNADGSLDTSCIS